MSPSFDQFARFENFLFFMWICAIHFVWNKLFYCRMPHLFAFCTQKEAKLNRVLETQSTCPDLTNIDNRRATNKMAPICLGLLLYLQCTNNNNNNNLSTLTPNIPGHIYHSYWTRKKSCALECSNCSSAMDEIRILWTISQIQMKEIDWEGKNGAKVSSLSENFSNHV